MNFPQAPPSSAQPLPYPRQKRGSGGKLVAVALLVAMGAGVYHYQDQLREIWERTMPPEPGLPSTVDTPNESPTPGVDPDPDAVPRPAEPAPEPQYTSPFPTPSPEPKLLTPEPKPPRAVPVEDSMANAIPAETSLSEPAPTTQPPVPPLPAMGEQTSRTLDRGMVASSTSTSLVEVGRARDDPSILPKMDTNPIVGNSDRPILRDVPPVCNAAVQGLKKFLAASNWKERMPYVQLADQMQRKAEIYYATNQDGPVDVDAIRYLRHDIDPQIGKGMHVVFELSSRAWNYTVPVMVEQINDETRVDWLTFVEFKDDLLNKFTSNYMDGPVRFHVGIRRSHYFEDDVPNADQKDVFEVTTPMENVTTYVFTPKGTPLARSLASTLSWDKEVSWVVVELQWRKEGTHKWIELTALPQLNWYSDGSAPESVSAPSSAVAVPGAAAP